MNIQLTWQDETMGLHRVYKGDISMIDVLESTLALETHPKFQPLEYVIEDFTQITNPPFQPEQTESFSSVVRVRASTKSNLKIALLSRNTPESIAAAEHFCKQMEGCHFQCEIFCCLEDAQTWATSS